MPVLQKVVSPCSVGARRRHIIATAIVLVISMATDPRVARGNEAQPLAQCPASPNCVCSEYAGSEAFVEPLPAAGDAAWNTAVEAVTAIGGEIVTHREGYLRATFTTRWLRFVDDLELRLDAAAQVIHVRSASRVGYYDFGVNRRRVESLRSNYLERLGGPNAGS